MAARRIILYSARYIEYNTLRLAAAFSNPIGQAILPISRDPATLANDQRNQLK